MTFIEKVKKLYSNKDYELAISFIDEAGDSINNPIVLVWKSRCLQLLNDNVPNNVLEEVEECLTKALNLDSEHQEALIELAYFYLRVLDDAKRAKPLFERSLSLVISNATESIVGIAECVSDLESDDLALKYLDKNRAIFIEPDKFQEAREELLSQASVD
jgi:tetratricopeptide (TPR) repeat protein